MRKSAGERFRSNERHLLEEGGLHPLPNTMVKAEGIRWIQTGYKMLNTQTDQVV